MKAYINRRTVLGPWGGGNMWVKAIHEHMPHNGFKLVEIQDKPDVIFIVGLSAEGDKISALQAIEYKRRHDPNVKLILRVNENDLRKGTTGVDEAIKIISHQMDHVVFVSKWLKDYFQAENWNVASSFIYNGVDKEVFSPRDKLQNGKINIVTHHWSDNYKKGFDVYESIDKWLLKNTDFSFTYIGRHRNTFQNTRIVDPLFGAALGEELSKYDVYVSASRHDPGPNHIIESLSCDIPTYVCKDGGGCVEFAGQDHTYDNVDEILKILELRNYPKNTKWTPGNWKECVSQFANLAKDLLHEKCS